MLVLVIVIEETGVKHNQNKGIDYEHEHEKIGKNLSGSSTFGDEFKY